jgi:hypothetical protein
VNLRTETLPLEGFGVKPTKAQVEIQVLTSRERLKRGAMGPALGFGMALVTLPIPLVHLFFPAAALIAGVVFGVRRGLTRELFHRATGPCPFCGAEQRLGLTGSSYRVPHAVKCSECLQPLTLQAA